MTKIVNSEVPD